MALTMILAASATHAQYRRGVNVSGAEFGQSVIPGLLGTNYTFNSEATFQYFGRKTLGLFRIPLLWERLQPTLDGPLDPDYLANLKNNIAWAKASGGEVIIDIQNFGRYSFNVGGMLVTYIIDNPGPDGAIKVTSDNLADLWVRISNEFKFEGGVYGYDLMNEPHDMGSADWRAISQKVLSAIRANQDDKLVLVPGDSWSSANRWVITHGTQSWIHDPANNYLYEAHEYFDSDESGSYKRTYDEELASNSNLANIGPTRLAHFVDWVQNNNVRGIVDEYGVPSTDPRWETVLDNFLTALDAAGMDGACWAAGEWWPLDYALAIQPTNNFTVDRPQIATLTAHAGGGYLTAISSASGSVARATSDSLMSVYGSGFTDQSAAAATIPYPLALGDVTVQVTDASGASAPAGLLYVSSGQINLQMPSMLAPGRATLVVNRAGAKVASGSIQIASAGPGIFTANSAGYGIPAAWLIRVSGSTVTYESVATAIDFGAPSDQLYLSLYATGLGSSTVSVKIGGVDAPVQYAGPQSQPGVDQINVALPRTLAGAGQVNVIVTAGGVAANGVTVEFK